MLNQAIFVYPLPLQVCNALTCCGADKQADYLEQTLHNLLFGTNPGKLEPPETESQRTLFISDADGVIVKELAPNRSALTCMTQRNADGQGLGRASYCIAHDAFEPVL